MLSMAARFLIMMSVAGLANGTFTAKIGIMVRLHGMDGARLGAARDEAAGAAIMAINHIRSRNASLVPDAGTLHPNFDVEFEIVDTRSDASVGVQHALAFSERGIHCIVGAARSAVSGPVAIFAGLTNTPVLSYSSTAASLGTSTYPAFSRVIPNDALPAFSLIKVCKEFGWTRIALIYIDDSYGQGYAQSVQNFAAEQDVDVLVSQSFSTGRKDSINNAIQGVNQSGARIIFCITFAQDIEAIAVAATTMGIVGKGYVWMSGDSILNPAGLMESSPDPASLHSFLSGFLTIHTKPMFGEKGQVFDAVWQYEKKRIDLAPLNAAAQTYTVDEMAGDCTDMCGYIYDAVWASAFAVNAAVDYETLDLDKSQLVSKLREQHFQGSTGTISFDPETGDRAAGGISVIYQNWVPSADGASIEVVDVYQWDGDSGVMVLGPVPVWGGGIQSEVPPPDGACERGRVYSAETLSCLPCKAGTAERNGVCVACEIGKVAPSPGSSACVQCESGYADREGMTECAACPQNSVRNSSTLGVSRSHHPQPSPSAPPLPPMPSPALSCLVDSARVALCCDDVLCCCAAALAASRTLLSVCGPALHRQSAERGEEVGVRRMRERREEGRGEAEAEAGACGGTGWSACARLGSTARRQAGSAVGVSRAGCVLGTGACRSRAMGSGASRSASSSGGISSVEIGG